MFNIDWDSVIKKIIDEIRKMQRGQMIEKMRADFFVLYRSQGDSPGEALKKATLDATFFATQDESKK